MHCHEKLLYEMYEKWNLIESVYFGIFEMRIVLLPNWFTDFEIYQLCFIFRHQVPCLKDGDEYKHHSTIYELSRCVYMCMSYEFNQYTQLGGKIVRCAPKYLSYGRNIGKLYTAWKVIGQRCATTYFGRMAPLAAKIFQKMAKLETYENCKPVFLDRYWNTMIRSISNDSGAPSGRNMSLAIFWKIHIFAARGARKISKIGRC